MSKNIFNLPTQDECTITLVQEGKSVDCDVYEVHELTMDARTEAEKTGANYGDIFINSMFDRYEVKLTYSAAKLLILKVREMMVEIKKKCTQLPDLGIHTDSAEST